MIMMETLDLIGYVACCFINILAVLVNNKLYTNIKNEKPKDKGKVIQQILKVYSLIQCTAWPILSIYYGLLYLIFPVLGIIEFTVANYLISGLRFTYTLLLNFLSFHSLIIAISRYIFVIHSSMSEKLGIKKLGRWLIGSSMAVPFVITFLYDATYPIEDSFVSTFYENSAVQKTNDTLTGFKNDVRNNVYETPIYLIFHKYFPVYLIYGLRSLWGVMFFITYCNVIEGCLYTHASIVITR